MMKGDIVYIDNHRSSKGESSTRWTCPFCKSTHKGRVSPAQGFLVQPPEQILTCPACGTEYKLLSSLWMVYPNLIGAEVIHATIQKEYRPTRMELLMNAPLKPPPDEGPDRWLTQAVIEAILGEPEQLVDDGTFTHDKDGWKHER